MVLERRFLNVWRILFGPLCPGAITVGITTVKHLVDAGILFATNLASGSIPFAAMLSVVPGFLSVIPGVSLLSREHLLAVLLLMCASTAIWAMHDRKLNHKLVALLLLPQQTILLITATGAAVAVWQGAYPDGYTPVGTHLFILGDQVIRLLLAPAYSVAIFARANAHEFARSGASGNN